MIDIICWNNFLTYQQLILLYYFHQKIFKSKTTIFKSCNFFGQTCFLHSGNQLFAYHAYILTSLISWFISRRAFILINTSWEKKCSWLNKCKVFFLSFSKTMILICSSFTYYSWKSLFLQNILKSSLKINTDL